MWGGFGDPQDVVGALGKVKERLIGVPETNLGIHSDQSDADKKYLRNFCSTSLADKPIAKAVFIAL